MVAFYMLPNAHNLWKWKETRENQFNFTEEYIKK